MRVFLAGPVDSGDICDNVNEACRIANYLMTEQFSVYIPQLCVLMQMISRQHYETWMRNGQAWLAVSNAVYRMPGESKGADRDVALAAQLGIPIFYTTEELITWARGSVRTGS